MTSFRTRAPISRDSAGGDFNRRGRTVEQCRAGVARTRRRHGDGKPPHPDGDGRSRLWLVGNHRRRRLDRRRAQALSFREAEPIRL